MRRIPALVLVTLLASPALLASRDVLWTIQDPRGDDRGEGTLLYPLNRDMQIGRAHV